MNNEEVILVLIHKVNILKYKNLQDKNNLIYLQFQVAYIQENHKNYLLINHLINLI